MALAAVGHSQFWEAGGGGGPPPSGVALTWAYNAAWTKIILLWLLFR